MEQPAKYFFKMIQLVFATTNKNKVAEINEVAGNQIDIITMSEAGIDTDIPEPYPTLEENAFAKSLYVYRYTRKCCFSEDTGLEVFALNGEPGVRSARYAGEPSDPKKNMEWLLKKLSNQQDKSAQFRMIISLIFDKVEYQFEGICKGKIIDSPRGEQGFGYDPVFIPEGSDKTFAEMMMDEKNKFSHRKKATEKLLTFLHTYHGKATN